MAKKTSDTAPSCGSSSSEQKRWQAEDALRTLNRAEEIRRDKGLMKSVAKLAEEQIRSLVPHISPKKPAANALMVRK